MPDCAKLRGLVVRLGLDVALFMVPIPNLGTTRILKYAAASARLVSQRGSLGAFAKKGSMRIEKTIPVVSRHLDL